MIHCKLMALTRDPKTLQANQNSYENDAKLKFLMKFENFASNCYTYDDVSFAMRILEQITTVRPWSSSFQDERKPHFKCVERIKYDILHTIINQPERNDLLFKFISCLLSTIELIRFDSWTKSVTESFEMIMEKTSKSDRALLLHLIIEFEGKTRTTIFQLENALKSFTIKLLTEKILETDMLTKEQL